MPEIANNKGYLLLKQSKHFKKKKELKLDETQPKPNMKTWKNVCKIKSEPQSRKKQLTKIIK